jgi:hypothetical protein
MNGVVMLRLFHHALDMRTDSKMRYTGISQHNAYEISIKASRGIHAVKRAIHFEHGACGFGQGLFVMRAGAAQQGAVNIE